MLPLPVADPCLLSSALLLLVQLKEPSQPRSAPQQVHQVEESSLAANLEIRSMYDESTHREVGMQELSQEYQETLRQIKHCVASFPTHLAAEQPALARGCCAIARDG